MDIFPYAAFGIVATCIAVSWLVLCTCAYLKIHANSDVRGSDGDLPMYLPRSISGDMYYQRRDSFGFGSSIGGGPISSISPNVSRASSSGSGGSHGNPFGSSILIGQEEDGEGDELIGNDTCDGELEGNSDMDSSSNDGGGDGGGRGGDCEK